MSQMWWPWLSSSPFALALIGENNVISFSSKRHSSVRKAEQKPSKAKCVMYPGNADAQCSWNTVREWKRILSSDNRIDKRITTPILS